MTLLAPNLDDRRFQDLVDDAKRYVQQHCPEWSDHNVSDPGVTLIETFAMVTDQLLYRLNRVPERLYVRFLELLGMGLVPPAAARGEATFWLSAPREQTVRVPSGAEVATERTEAEEAVAFETLNELAIDPCTMAAIATAGPSGEAVDRTEQLRVREPFNCFGQEPAPGDVLLVGLSDGLPRHVVALEVDCRAEGAGIDPLRPPLVWEAWTGRSWAVCEVDSDGTGGFNRPGAVVLHLPPGHQASTIAGHRAGWLRCRTIQPLSGQRFYQRSPRILAATAAAIGATTDVVHAETVRDEYVGLSEGVPGQRFPLSRGPVLTSGAEIVVEVADDGDAWRPWTRVDDFDASSPTDEHYVLDATAGEIVFAPAVREVDGRIRYLGAVPRKASPVRATFYRVGGGRRGNVARGAISAMRTSVPFVSSVANRRPANGGVDGEDLAAAIARAPAFLRTRQRAVTVGDYEYLATVADPRVGRVRCLSGSGPDAAVLRVVLLPVVSGHPGQPGDLRSWNPPPDLVQRVAGYLDERRVLGTRLLVEPPFFQTVRSVARLSVAPGADAERVVHAATVAMYRFLHPMVGGPDGDGWAFGRTVTAGELLAEVARVPGVESVADVKLYRSERPDDGWANRVDLGQGALPFSQGHGVELVERQS